MNLTLLMRAIILRLGAQFCRRRKMLFIAAALLITGFVLMSNRICMSASRGKIFASLDRIPTNEVALVLGTSKTTSKGSANLHFVQRIDAAAALFRAGKVRHLLVSGDNHTAGYDEPTDMRDALMAAGVPASVITRDYAGFRTLDSILRAQKVFGLTNYTIVTEAFHCPRAIWIARRHGINAVAFAAPDVTPASWSWRAKTREAFARGWCAMDLYILNRGPKFLGPREPILVSSRP